MAQCKNYGRSGLFLSVSPRGLCKQCDPVVAKEIVGRERIIRESLGSIHKSKNLDTKVSRCDIAIVHAQALIPYMNKDIPTITPDPASVLRTLLQAKQEALVEELTKEYDQALDKVTVPGITPRTKVNALTKGLTRIGKYKPQADDPSPLESLEQSLLAAVHSVQLTNYLDDARKAEFMGQKKKALDKYYEALYFLRNDDIEDSLQQENISTIEAKVKELGGEIPA